MCGLVYLFFFQAEDGIRDGTVTGVQTCALPISRMSGVPGYKKARARVLTCVVQDDEKIDEIHELQGQLRQLKLPRYPNRRMIQVANRRVLFDERSEERRVGKECRSRWARDQ